MGSQIAGLNPARKDFNLNLLFVKEI